LALAPAAFLARKCGCGQHAGGGQCAECRKQSEATLQRRAVRTGELEPVPEIVHDVLHSPGHPLDDETRAFFEPRFGHDFSQVRVNPVMQNSIQPHLTIGPSEDRFEQEAETMAERVIRLSTPPVQQRHDFSQVRIHTGAAAAASARALDALAYTVGRDVVFGEGQYAPHSLPGRRLIAHELAHVVQQKHLCGAPASISEPDSALEREAAHAAEDRVAPRRAEAAERRQEQLVEQRFPAQEVAEGHGCSDTGDGLEGIGPCARPRLDPTRRL